MATATPLFESPDLFLAELSVPPDDPQLGEDNQIVHPIVALPAGAVCHHRRLCLSGERESNRSLSLTGAP